MLDTTSPDFQGLPPFVQLVRVVQALRGPGGCPWDRAQTHQSMARFVLEEAHELLETLDAGEPSRLCEELGDLLFQVVFHAQLGREREEFGIDDVCRSIVDKMIGRHPHVFGEADPEEVLSRWEERKREETGRPRGSLREGIPASLPSLLQACRVQDRAAEVGFEWPDPGSAAGKVREELHELESALVGEGRERQEEELGDLLFAVVGLARRLEIDPEAAARKAVTKFVQRFQALEQRFQGDLSGLGPEEMVRAWRSLETPLESP